MVKGRHAAISTEDDEEFAAGFTNDFSLVLVFLALGLELPGLRIMMHGLWTVVHLAI